MKASEIRLFVFLISAAVAGSVVAESRLWKDTKGKTIEAEHVRTTNDKVVLRQMDGSEISVSLDTLSEKDRRYAILLAPPRVDIDVSTKVDRENKAIGGGNYGPGVQMQRESVQAEVKIKKTSSPAYEAPLMSEVYLIGESENGEAYVILDHTKSRFKFSTENEYEHRYLSGSVRLRQLESGRDIGVEYKGYIAIVRDRTGDVLAVKGNKKEFEENAEIIVASSKGDAFDRSFNPMDREEIEKAKEKARSKAKRRMPGRRF